VSYIVIWTELAQEKIREIYYYLDEFNSELAQNAFDAIITYVENLKKTPKKGRPADMREVEYHELIIPFGSSGYIALYEVVGKIIFIHSIRHQKEAGYKT
jgi:plasmid stabilization system protein ParE